MILNKKSNVTGICHTLEIPNLCPDKYELWEEYHETVKDGWDARLYFPELTQYEIAFILTGMSKMEWDFYARKGVEDESDKKRNETNYLYST